MQKNIDTSFFDWSRSSKPAILARGLAAIIPQPLKQETGLNKGSSRYIWPSGYDNISSRYLSRRIKSR